MVLGENPLYWFIPFCKLFAFIYIFLDSPHEGEGIKFEINPKFSVPADNKSRSHNQSVS